MVGGQVCIDAHIRPLRVHIGPLASLGAKAIGHSVFDFQCRKVQTGQWAVLRSDFDFESLLGGEPNLPRHITGGFVKVFFVAVQGLRQLHQHPLGQATMQIEQQGFTPGGPHDHATPPGHQVLAGQTGDAVDLVGQKTLDTGGAR